MGAGRDRANEGSGVHVHVGGHVRAHVGVHVGAHAGVHVGAHAGIHGGAHAGVHVGAHALQLLKRGLLFRVQYIVGQCQTIRCAVMRQCASVNKC